MAIVHNHISLTEQVMELMLSGDDGVLEQLRNQYHYADLGRIQNTGKGYFAFYSMSPNAKKLKTPVLDFELNDVVGKVGSNPNAVGFVLFIRDGYINNLEAFTYISDTWPLSDTLVIPGFAEGDKRNLEEVRLKWNQEKTIDFVFEQDIR